MRALTVRPVGRSGTEKPSPPGASLRLRTPPRRTPARPSGPMGPRSAQSNAAPARGRSRRSPRGDEGRWSRPRPCAFTRARRLRPPWAIASMSIAIERKLRPRISAPSPSSGASSRSFCRSSAVQPCDQRLGRAKRVRIVVEAGHQRRQRDNALRRRRRRRPRISRKRLSRTSGKIEDRWFAQSASVARSPGACFSRPASRSRKLAPATS